MGRKRGCARCRAACCPDSDESDASSDAGSVASNASVTESDAGEVVESDWWQEREFDSMFFAPGMFVSGSARDMTNTLAPENTGMTKSMKAVATALPDAAPLDREPLWQQELQGLTMDSLRRQLEGEPFIFELAFMEEMSAREFQPSCWQEGVRIPGTQIRGCKFKMPMPADIPGIMRRMMTIPDTADVRALFRMRCGNDRVDIVQQTITDGVPMSDAFRIQVTHSFTPGSAGVLYSKWVDVVWLKSAMGMIQSYVSQKADVSGRQGADILKKVLLSASSS